MENINFLLPEEAAEMTQTQVKLLRRLEQQLRQLFENSNYQEVMPPNFEYVSLYNGLNTDFSQEKMFQFINHEGESIALRYDFTIPLARAYALSGSDEVARYAYFGKVFRKEKRHKGRRTESYQIGLELLGATETDGDRECLTLTLKTIQQLPIQPILLELGSADFYRRIIQLAGPELSQLLPKKDLTGIKNFVAEKQFPTAFSQLLSRITVESDLEKLIQLVEQTEDSELLAAVHYLAKLSQNLPEAVIDLSMVPEMQYYRGLIFKAYSDKVAQPLISGGRYDDLLLNFQKRTYALGFCCHMDNVLKALELEGQDA